MIIKTSMTYHASVERIDRIVACIEHLGMDDFVLECAEPTRLYRLTNTGILFVFNERGDTLITGYMATFDKVAALYKSQGYERIPLQMADRIARNNKKYKFLLQL